MIYDFADNSNSRYDIIADMENKAYTRRGRHTLITLFMLRLPVAILFLFLGIILAVSDNYFVSLAAKFSPQYTTVVSKIFPLLTAGAFVFFIAIAGIISLVVWLQYISVEYLFDDESFKVRLGIFSIKELSIPYRQIQNVDVNRPLLYRLMGVSDITLLTAGREDQDDPDHAEADATVTLLEKKLAEQIQRDLLDRSREQHAPQAVAQPTFARTN